MTRGAVTTSTVLLVALALGGCSSTTESSLEAQVRDLPSVLSVTATHWNSEEEVSLGGQDLFEVEVVVAQDATAEQVAAVVAALGDDLDHDDGQVTSLDIEVEDRAELHLGTSAVPPRDVIDDVVAAAADETVVSYVRNVDVDGDPRQGDWPLVHEVFAQLAGDDLATGAALLDELGSQEGVRLASVTVGPHELRRETDADDHPDLFDARLAWVRELGARGVLTGSVVTGDTPLSLGVTAAAVDDVRREAARRGLGEVVVQAWSAPTPPVVLSGG